MLEHYTVTKSQNMTLPGKSLRITSVDGDIYLLILSIPAQRSEFSLGSSWQLCQDLADSLTVKQIR